MSETQTGYFLGDALGSVRQVVDPQAEILLAQSYSPYGEVLSSVGDYETAYSYTGEMTDGTGLVNLRVRFYDPGTGRFVSKDTCAGDFNNPITLGKWLYANGNPILYSDPSGKWALADGLDIEDGGFYGLGMLNISLQLPCLYGNNCSNFRIYQAHIHEVVQGGNDIRYAQYRITNEKGITAKPNEAPSFLEFEKFRTILDCPQSNSDIVEIRDIFSSNRWKFLTQIKGSTFAFDNSGSVYSGITTIMTDVDQIPDNMRLSYYKNSLGPKTYGEALDNNYGGGIQVLNQVTSTALAIQNMRFREYSINIEKDKEKPTLLRANIITKNHDGEYRQLVFQHGKWREFDITPGLMWLP